jgi:hypothetical protein
MISSWFEADAELATGRQWGMADSRYGLVRQPHPRVGTIKRR